MKVKFISTEKKQILVAPHDAMEAGISIVYQEFVLAPDLTVAENILFAQCMRKPVINWKKINQDARVLLDSLGFDIDSGAKVCELSVACQQVVEICKALSRNCRILILDEPTAVLAQNEVTQLFRLLKELRQRGVSIIYISHRLDEIMEIADQVTVLRDGENVQTVNTADVSKENIISMMIGRSLDAIYPKRKSNIGKVLLEAQKHFQRQSGPRRFLACKGWRSRRHRGSCGRRKDGNGPGDFRCR